MFESPERRVKTCSSSPASWGTMGSKICLRLISTSQTAAHINNPWERLESCQWYRRKSKYSIGSSQLNQQFLHNCFWMSDNSSINSFHVILLGSNYILGYGSSYSLYCHCQRGTMVFSLVISHCQHVRMFLKLNRFCRRQRGINTIQSTDTSFLPFDSTQNHILRYYGLPLGQIYCTLSRTICVKWGATSVISKSHLELWANKCAGQNLLSLLESQPNLCTES